MNPPRRKPIDTQLLDLPRRHRVFPQRVAFSPHGMVSTAHYLATKAAVAVLAEGGNAVDAAVTAAFALGVCEPQASGIGGQTTMLVHIANPRETFALDGSSRAPNRAVPGLLKSRHRLNGYRATTVPTTAATLGYALKQHGSISLERALSPAIALAQEGIEVSELLHALSLREAKKLRAGNAGEFLLRQGRRVHPAGSILRQPVLAATLRRLATAGVEDMYTGQIARDIHEDMEANGGLLHADDLARIPWPIQRKPVASRFRSQRVVTFPPPGAGRALLEMLNIYDNIPREECNIDTPRGALLLASVMRRAALDRQDRPFSADLYAQVEGRKMVSRKYAKATAAGLRRRIKTKGETTHLSVMDRYGNAVGLTQSIERVFGAGVATPKLGFLYNNYMSAFEYRDISHPYYLRPNAVPWGSVAPTIVFRGQKPSLVIGSPGSDRIVTAILQIMLRLANHSPYDAVEAPRIHCNPEGRVSLEAARFRDDIPRLLQKKGFTIDSRDAYSFYMGSIHLVARARDGLTGVADPRRDGAAGGPS